MCSNWCKPLFDPTTRASPALSNTFPPVPRPPMATPTCAARNAGASFTPSPVIKQHVQVARCEQQQEHRLAHGLHGNRQQGAPLPCGQCIVAVLGQALGSLDCGQTRFGADHRHASLAFGCHAEIGKISLGSRYVMASSSATSLPATLREVVVPVCAVANHRLGSIRSSTQRVRSDHLAAFSGDRHASNTSSAIFLMFHRCAAALLNQMLCATVNCRNSKRRATDAHLSLEVSLDPSFLAAQTPALAI